MSDFLKNHPKKVFVGAGIAAVTIGTMVYKTLDLSGRDEFRKLILAGGVATITAAGIATVASSAWKKSEEDYDDPWSSTNSEASNSEISLEIEQRSSQTPSSIDSLGKTIKTSRRVSQTKTVGKRTSPLQRYKLRQSIPNNSDIVASTVKRPSDSGRKSVGSSPNTNPIGPSPIEIKHQKYISPFRSLLKKTDLLMFTAPYNGENSSRKKEGSAAMETSTSTLKK